MKSYLFGAVAALMFVACSPVSVPKATKVSQPGCSQNPEICLNGYLIRTDSSAVYQISRSIGLAYMTPEQVDDLVGAGTAKFYWPEDEDTAGKEKFNDLVTRNPDFLD